MANVLEAYSKANKIIESCERPEHIEAARNYINLFLIAFSKVKARKWLRPTLVSADRTVTLMYEELQKNLKKTEKKLSK